ncbi:MULTISPECIES: hypothetical protein [Haloarcula]|uniref:hypothetical protein n=1 Tax=Haloarcula TaxID=2237 RepID=UPI000F8F099A|nr:MULTISPECIES: hypothetical protein [Haloarcula]NHX39373.1 hypothetical protein [Haloarcula sp. R1-2]
MTDDLDGSSEPDGVRYSYCVSRREILAAGAAGVATGLAGCNAFNQDESLDGTDSTPPPEEDQQLDIQVNLVEVSLDTIRFKLFGIKDYDPDTFRVDIYSNAPVADDDDRRPLAREEYQAFPQVYGAKARFEDANEYFDGYLNTPQELIFEIAIDDGEAQEVHRTHEAIMMFENKARGTTEIRSLGPKFASRETWDSDTTPKQKVELWYNEPDESPFNVPKLDKSEYSETDVDGDDWFDLKNIEITALVRTPIFTTAFYVDDDDEVQGPYYDWTVFTVRMSEIEYLEAVYFNSPSTMRIAVPDTEWSIGDGGARQKEIPHKTNYGSNVTVGNISEPVAQESDDAVVQLLEAAVFPDRSPNEFVGANPLRFAVGRAVSKRWARKIEEAFENKHYLSSLETPDYHKLTVLKAFVGDALPYKWTLGRYHNSPEESIIELFKNGTEGVENTEGADCVTASILFAGIGYWLVDAEPVLPWVYVSGRVKHLFTGWGGLDMPDLRRNRSPNALGYEGPDTPHSSDKISYDYWNVECTEGFSSIGFIRGSIADTQYLAAWSNGDPLQLTTHIRLNEADEPDIDGEIKVDRTENEGIIKVFDDNPLYRFESE